MLLLLLLLLACWGALVPPCCPEGAADDGPRCGELWAMCMRRRACVACGGQEGSKERRPREAARHGHGTASKLQERAAEKWPWKKHGCTIDALRYSRLHSLVKWCRD